MNTVFDTFPVLKTERLQLRELQQTDVAEVFILRSDPALFKYLPFDPAESIEQMSPYIEKMRAGSLSGESIIWGITEIENPNLIIGSVCLFNYEQDALKGELGYVLNKAHHGKGYVNEAARAVCDFAFHQIGAKMLVAIFHEENEKSRNVLKRLDFELEEDAQWQIEEENALTYSCRNIGYEELPVFRYSPRAIENAQVIRRKLTCDVCSKLRNYIYAGPFYSEKPVDIICPWCLSDGKLQEKQEGVTVKPELCETVSDENSLSELTKKSPSYNAWRDEKWPSHCGDFCAFDSYIHYDDIREKIETIKEDWEKAQVNLNLSDEEMTEFRGKNWRIRGYLFNCLHCDAKRFLADKV